MLKHEDGVRKACDALEDLWMSPRKKASSS